MEIKNRNYDLRKLPEKYLNKWLALPYDHKKVYAAGDSLEDVMMRVKRLGKRIKAVFLKLPPAKCYYMPSFYEI